MMPVYLLPGRCKMTKKAVTLILGLMIVAWLAAFQMTSEAAAPMPPELAVNHEKRQCALVIRGDECVICSLPEGWVILGQAGDVQCPVGYEMVEIELICKGVRELRCFLPGHSGG